MPDLQTRRAIRTIQVRCHGIPLRRIDFNKKLVYHRPFAYGDKSMYSRLLTGISCALVAATVLGAATTTHAIPSQPPRVAEIAKSLSSTPPGVGEPITHRVA